MEWNASVEETDKRDGTFRAALHEVPLEITSRDPENDLCHAMVEAGLADGPIQFWRGNMPSLLYRSVHRTAGYRITMGDNFPQRVKRDQGRAENLRKFTQGSIAGGQSTNVEGDGTGEAVRHG